jgi:serine/threonine protein kinase
MFYEDEQEEPQDPVPYIGPELAAAIWFEASKKDTAKDSFDWAPLPLHIQNQQRQGPRHRAPEQLPLHVRKSDPESLDQAQGTKLALEESKPNSKLPVDVDKKCGVALEGDGLCERDLGCPIHSEDLKNAVPGRSEPYRVLRMRAEAKSESQSLQNASKPTTRMIISISKGDHLELKEEDKEFLPYILERILGHGGSASVEMVRDRNTGSVYARKIIRNVHTRNLKAVKLSFLNEVRVMRLLSSHHHIIQVFATYIAQRELALILSPVADGGDLHDFLGRYQDAGTADPERDGKTGILYRAFGCLASGLAFMHQERVRHKDIKPKNILIHQGSVLYTDFGISFDFSQQEQSTTIGNPHSYTKRYCAPEVADWGTRNSKSDIFSLGCVFIEILAAISPHLFNDTFLEGPFYETVDELSAEHLNPLDEFCHWCVGLLQEMLQKSPTERPTAPTLVKKIDTAAFDLFCGLCSNDLNSKNISSHSLKSNDEEPSQAV